MQENLKLSNDIGFPNSRKRVLAIYRFWGGKLVTG